MTDAAERLARRQGFVLRPADLRALGLTRSAVRHRLRQGAWTGVAHGVVSPLRLDDGADPWMLARRHAALVAAAGPLRRPGHVVSGRSAAVLLGLPVLVLPDVAELTDPAPDGLGRRDGAHLFGAALPSRQRASWYGVPVTTAARTVVDLARHNRRDGIMAADAAVRDGLASPAELERTVRSARGWPGVRQARRVVALADPCAESPLESVVRLLMHDDGMPTPVLQLPVSGYRVDLALPEQRLVVEADGRGKYVGDALWREKQREEVLRRAGWTVERVLWADTTRAGWPATSARLWAAIRRPPPRPVWS